MRHCLDVHDLGVVGDRVRHVSIVADKEHCNHTEHDIERAGCLKAHNIAGNLTDFYETALVHKLTVVDEAERCDTAGDEEHPLVTADHRVHKRKSERQIEIRIRHLDGEYCNNRKREGRKQQELLFVAVLEV